MSRYQRTICTCPDHMHDDLLGIYYDIACRLGDEKTIVERFVRRLYFQVRDNNIPANLPNKCITIPRRLKLEDQVYNRYLHGQVWRWVHLKETVYYNVQQLLKPLKKCVAKEHHEICLNGTHYQLQNSPNTGIVEAEPWASIAYYEKGTKLGDVCFVDTTGIQIVCNSTATTTPSIDLDQIPNKSNDWFIANTRQQIGSGIILHYVSSQIFVELVSDSDLFLNSKFRNWMRGSPLKTICQLSPFGFNLMKLMCDDHFHKIIEQEVQKSPEAVYALANLCTVRLSFVEQWSDEKPITEVPCWIEIRFMKHLKWLQRTLKEIDAPYKLHF